MVVPTSRSAPATAVRAFSSVDRAEMTLTERHEPDRPRFILVGGATGVGKSMVASALAGEFGITRVVTTDTVREVLRSVVARDRDPALHVSSFEAGDVDPGAAAAPDPVVAGFQGQVASVSVGVEALFRRAIVEATDTICEGVHLVPGAIRLPDAAEAFVVHLIIVADDPDAHRSYLVARARDTSRRPPTRYLTRFNEIRRIQAEIIRRAEEHGVPTVRSTDRNATTANAVAVVEKALTPDPLI